MLAANSWVNLTNKLGRLAAMAIIGAVPFTLYYLYERPTVSQEYFLELTIPIAALLFLGLKVITGKIFVIKTGQDIFILLYAAIVLVSTMLSPYPYYYVKAALFLLCLIVMYYWLLNLALGRRDIDKILFLYVIISLPITTYGILQYFGLEFLGYLPERKVGKLNVLSFLGHPNYIASFLVPVIFINLIFLLGKKSPVFKVVCSLSVTLTITCVILGGTRAGWLGLIVSLLIIFFALRGLGYYSRYFKKLVIVLLIFFLIILCLLIVPNPLLPSKYDMLRRVTSTGEIISRLYAWQIGWQMIKDKPLLGIGYSGFSARYWDYVDKFQEQEGHQIFDFFNAQAEGIPPGQAHNEYIEIAAETGLLGLALFLLILITFFDRLISSVKHWGVEGQHQLYLVCFGGAILSMLVDSLFGFPLQLPCSGLLFWVLLAISTHFFPPLDSPPLKNREVCP